MEQTLALDRPSLDELNKKIDRLTAQVEFLAEETVRQKRRQQQWDELIEDLVPVSKEIEKLDFPPVREFLQMIADAGGHLYGCKMSMDMMKLTKNDLFPGVEGVLGAMEFMEISEGAQTIFI